jgi:diguanylate cyclase (GGDEF)-like protein
MGVNALRVLNSGTLKSLLVPGGIWLLGVVLLVYSGWLTLALPVLSFLYYCAIAGGMLLAWRFHSSRIFLSLLVVLIAQQAAAISAGQAPFIPATLQAIAVLVPVNFVLIAMMHERGFTVESVAPALLFLFVQSLTVTVFCGAAVRVRSLSNPIALPRYAMVVIASAAIFLSVRFLLNRKPVDSALLWSLATFFLALRSVAATRTSMAYWATSACILATAVIENSYLLAYHDELTTLPSRRAFNDALLRLKSPYSIAVVDIDHFKRFNDTYGHDTGDQVLRMVAANLGQVTGGGQAYRCGGEEFNILFSGKTTAEVLPHLQKLRETVEKAEFRMRGNDDRRQVARGPDRRNQRKKTRTRKGDAIRRLAEGKPSSALSVTISIGVATAATERSSPEMVQESADKALYRAKANGRNRVETATSSPRRMRTKAAGIA